MNSPHLLLEMVKSPWFWLELFLSIVGGVLVYLGLRIEKRAEKMIPPSDFDGEGDIYADIVRKQKLEEHRGWRILMTGIIIEVVAAFGITVISGLEIASLSDQTALANLAAKQAKQDAAQANERASANELAVALLTSNNLVLRSNVVELEKQMQPRRITDKQLKDFIFLTKYVPKIPIEVVSGIGMDERFGYASQIRYMLSQAGFGVELDTNKPSLNGVNVFATAFSYPLVLGTNEMPSDVSLIMDNKFPSYIGAMWEHTNGFDRIIVEPTTNRLAIYLIVRLVFDQVGIKSTICPTPKWVKDGKCFFFVEEKGD
jgi:hypothetical protein